MKYVGRILLVLFLLLNALLTMGCAKDMFANASLPNAAGRFSSMTSEYPGVVMVITPNNTGMCTGSIVAQNTVLTAAHCLTTSGTYTVRTKNGDFRTSYVRYAGTGSVDDTNDVGILVFNTALTNVASEIYPIADRADQGDAVTVVGFGCNSVENRTGSGVKRAGTNIISDKTDYLVLLTPKTVRRVIGDENQAGTCFGDSGGPLLRNVNGQLYVAGVTHAGGTYNDYYVSEFTNVSDNSWNRQFLANAARSAAVSIKGL